MPKNKPYQSRLPLEALSFFNFPAIVETLGISKAGRRRETEVGPLALLRPKLRFGDLEDAIQTAQALRDHQSVSPDAINYARYIIQVALTQYGNNCIQFYFAYGGAGMWDACAILSGLNCHNYNNSIHKIKNMEYMKDYVLHNIILGLSYFEPLVKQLSNRDTNCII
jgi:hypothetical protein